jgi:hypothetical protein
MGSPPRLRFVDEGTAIAGQREPLINALFERLPPAGSAWPEAQRQAWLSMMETTFTIVYGAAGKASTPRATRRAAPAARRPARAAAKKPKALKGAAPAARRPARAAAKKPKALKGAGPAFFIDRQHFARRRGGERIVPGDVAGILVDKRGMNGDLAAIIWADDSTGIPRGLQLDIGVSEGDD